MTRHETALDLLDASAVIAPSTMGGRAENGQLWRIYTEGHWDTVVIVNVNMSAQVSAKTVSANGGGLAGQYMGDPVWEYTVRTVEGREYTVYGTTPGRRIV